MAALIQDRNTPSRAGSQLVLPVEASTVIFAGSMVAINASGRAVAASDFAGLKVIGRANTNVDNSAGVAGALSVTVERMAAFKFANSAGSPIVAGGLLGNALAADDQTVATATVNNVVAGKVLQIDTDGVWVEIV